ncbi:MAG TPA: MFS transporter [Candidatus Saccharimonadales bacterium]|nr:MFS transporter [Candidatus Saccharimonadales bacterium]
MQVVHFYHRNHLYRFTKNPDFYYFEIAIWLHTLAHSLITVFVPIILLKSGYSIPEIIIYFLIFNTLDIPLNFVVDSLLRKIGARKVLILGTLAIIAFFGLIGVIPPSNWPLLILLAFFSALYDTLFWISHIYLFIEASRNSKDTGLAVGSLEGLRKFASIVGPALGALILLTVGKGFLVIVSIVIFALSIIPLFQMKHIRDIPTEKKLSFKQFFVGMQKKRDFLSLAFWGINVEVDDVLWPFFIFLIFGSVESVAAVPVVVSLTAAAFSFFVGKLSNKNTPKMIIIGSIVIALFWIMRILFQNPLFYYLSIFAVGLFSLLVAIPLDKNIAVLGIESGPLATSTYRNVTAMLLRVPLYIALVLLVEIFKVSFAVAALSVITIIFITTVLGNVDKTAKI